MDIAMIASTEEIISVSFFDKHPEKSHIRLLCPNCYEPVHVIPYLGDRFHYFRHEVSTDSTPDCDLRVSNLGYAGVVRNNRTKITTPLYIRCLGDKCSIVARFGEISNFSYPQDYRMKISGMPSSTYRISRFINRMCEIILNFIPIGESCIIRIDGPDSRKIDGLREIWGRTVDSFSDHGAFFNQSTGRIVKKGWNLTTGSSYYLVTNDSPKRIPISCTKIGSVKDIGFNVYLVKIPQKPGTQFLDYIYNYGLHLADGVTSAELVWPPAIRCGSEFCPVIKDVDKVLKVNGLYESHIWADGNNNAIEKSRLCICKTKSLETINILFNDKVTSVDFIGSPSDLRLEMPIVDILDRNNNESDFGPESKKVVTNYHGSLIKIKSDGSFNIEEVAESGNDISNIFNILLFSNSIKQKEFALEILKNIYISSFNRKMLYGPRMDVPPWFRRSILKLGQEDKVVARVILDSVQGGTISKSVCDYLKRW